MLNWKDFFITVWDNDFNVLGIVDNIISLEWTRQMNESGSFTLEVPLTKQNLKLFDMGNIITKTNKAENQNKLLEGCFITYINISANSENDSILRIQGFSLLSWLAQRIISNTEKTVIEGYVEDIIEELINNECINPENADRIIPNLEIQKNSNLTVRTTYAVTKYSGLLESISSICQFSYYGIEMLMDISSKKYVINIYQGEDKSIETVYSPVIFSEEFNNILSDGYVKSLANYRNTAYVYGSIESGTNGNEVSKESTIEYPVGNDFTGLKRYETSIDCSDPQINGKKIKLTDLNFSQIATALAYENLSINQEVKNFTGTLNVESNLQYRRDFNVGDIVTCMNKDWNLNINSLIVSVSEQYSVNGLSVVIGFGYPLPSIIKKINSRYTRRM